ncbi:cellulose binding domain-containing protein [Streptomyces sp. NPDC008313]|uniref:cellulose binding domain-containing protein n=1 Tax=Streptomyces sp. NPDC008313 TaxID=3364826 RepID=UPI0036EDAF2A
MVSRTVRPPGRARPRAAAFVAVVGTLLACLAVYGPPSAARTDDGGVCRVSWTADQWSGGFTAQVSVTNLGPAVSSWELGWTFDAGQKVTSGWNARVTQDGTSVTAHSLDYNGSLPTGSSTSFGLQGTWSGTDPAPDDFTLNGASCGDGPAPTSGTSATPTGSPSGSASPSDSPAPSGSASPTPSDDPAPGCADATVCSGFEDQTGSIPSGSWTVVAPDCNGSGKVTVDSSVVHAGSRSLRVDGAAGYCNHAFAATAEDVSAVGPVVYGRLWVRHTTALPAAHVTMVTMADARDGGRELRIGGQNAALQWNRQSDDATLPAQSPAGVALSAPLPTGRWVCLRFAIDTTRQSMDTWMDDRQIAGLHVDGTPTQDVDSQWLSRTTAPRPTTLRLGWESYGTGDDTLWYDDIALGSSPLAC